MLSQMQEVRGGYKKDAALRRPLKLQLAYSAR